MDALIGNPPSPAAGEIQFLLDRFAEQLQVPHALVVAADLPAEQLAATLREGAGPLCESVRLFDVYTGPQVGEGHRSLAFALRFRAPDRTLTEKETAAARESAVALAAQRHGAQRRA